MIKSSINLARDLHRKMGYPLGKVHYKAQQLAGHLGNNGGPMRHVRRISYKVRNFGDVMERRKAAEHVLSDIDPKIVERMKEVRKNGFGYFNEFVDPALLAELKKFYDEVLVKRSEEAQASKTHPFFFSLIRDEDYTTDHILMRFALQENVVKALSAYFKSVPFMNSIGIQESRHVKIEKKSQRASQQWHLDYTKGGDEAVSMWVYFTDVPTLDQGPLTYLPLSASRKVQNKLFPGRIEDEQIVEFGLQDDVTPILGPAMTVFFVSTHAVYHMGSRVKEGNKRVVAIMPYYKAADIDNFVKIASPVTPEQKLIVSH